MERLYFKLIAQHLHHHRQMIFLAGPRQVGKTTLSLMTRDLTDHFHYFNWDNTDHQRLIISGPENVARSFEKSSSKPGIVVFDELHKYSRWKQFLKGFFDTYNDRLRIIVTGSSKLNIYRRIGDSLMGRYFLYRINPLSVAEINTPTIIETEIRPPSPISDEIFSTLMKFGGFPEPYAQASTRFYVRWQQLRQEQTFHEDIRALTHIHEMAQLEMLAHLLKSQSGQLMNYSNLAQAVNVSVPTIKRWINCLNMFYYCFTIQPWFKNVGRSLIKQPKVYLWDWSMIDDAGARYENVIAMHLLKAIQCWADEGLGEYGLYFLRDKEKREVDFLVVKNKKPWFIVEAKYSQNAGLSPSLQYFQEQIKVEHAFQVVYDMPYINKDCFTYSKPIIVPAKTFLSQLM